jgi:hypothetical protein
MLKLPVILILVAFAGCVSKETVTISARDVTLTYDCRNFQPQAKTQDQTLAIMEKSVEVLNEALEKDDIALYRSLKIARQLKDVRRMEELIVQFECAKKQAK